MLNNAVGWITVKPETMDKKNPVEKNIAEYGKVDLQTSLSRLSPVWMQHQS